MWGVVQVDKDAATTLTTVMSSAGTGAHVQESGYAQMMSKEAMAELFAEAGISFDSLQSTVRPQHPHHSNDGWQQPLWCCKGSASGLQVRGVALCCAGGREGRVRPHL